MRDTVCKGTLQSEFQRNVKLRITQAITPLAQGDGVSSSNYYSHDTYRRRDFWEIEVCHLSLYHLELYGKENTISSS